MTLPVSPHREIPFVSLGEPIPFPARSCQQFVDGSAAPEVRNWPAFRAIRVSPFFLRVRLEQTTLPPATFAEGRLSASLPGKTELVNTAKQSTDPKSDNPNPARSCALTPTPRPFCYATARVDSRLRADA
jgi:hypothetical protein